MNEKKSILGIAIAIIIIGIIFVYSSGNDSDSGGDIIREETKIEDSTSTRGSLSEDIKVPEIGENVEENNIAVPQNVSASDLSGKSNYRDFNLSLDGGKFVPDTVIVELGDTPNINITAVDKNYDFFQPDYGLKGEIVKGSILKVQFSATATGKFTFYCESCGGPEKGPVGFLVVVPKE